MEPWVYKYFYTVLPPLIALLMGIKHYGELDKALKFLLCFVVLGFFTEVLTSVMFVALNIRNNMPIGNAYFILSFILLDLYFMYLFEGYIKRRIFIALIVLYELYFIINLLFFQTIFEYPATPQAISNIICFGFGGLYFYKLMTEVKIKKLWNEPLVYINLAILLYYAGSLFYSVLFNLILEHNREFTYITRVYFYWLNIFFYLLIAVGFWKLRNQKTN